jgi:molybdopterin-guanine dinucleotide biosynthesis protein A
MTSIVLAGGKSLRLGKSKALETIGDKNLIQRVVERLAPVSSKILIVTSREYADFPVDWEAEIKVDIYPNRGPLGGIYTGLTASHSLYSIVVACDMPFLNIELLRYMMKLSPGFDAVVPRIGRLQPLHAIYSKSCLGVIKTQLDLGQLTIARFLDMVNVRYVERGECEKLDPKLLSFFNVNCQEDLDEAAKLTAGGKY